MAGGRSRRRRRPERSASGRPGTTACASRRRRRPALWLEFSDDRLGFLEQPDEALVALDAERGDERCLKSFGRFVCAGAGSRAVLGYVETDTAPADDTALDESELLQPRRDLAERLLGLRRPPGDLRDRDPGVGADVLQQPETRERQRAVAQRRLAQQRGAGRGRPQEVHKPVLP